MPVYETVCERVMQDNGRWLWQPKVWPPSAGNVRYTPKATRQPGDPCWVESRPAS